MSRARPLVTARQRQVLRLVSKGFGDVAIGTHLGISPLTVRTHLNAAFRRLNAKDRAHAVCLCYERGIFTPGGVS